MAKFPLRDWITGFVLERCSRAFEPKPIVAYLYNGVRLPALPEWDRDVYPFATITAHSGGLYCFNASDIVLALDYTMSRPNDSGAFLNIRSAYDKETESWGENKTSAVNGYDGSPIWSNFDIYKSDGSLYLSASEPVPIYK